MSEKGLSERKTGEKKENELLEKAIAMVARIPPEALTTEPEEVIQRISRVEFARQILGPEIMKRPDWPILWCRLICWIKYILCVLRCPPFLRDVLIRSVGRVDSLDPLNKASKLVANPPTGEEKPVGGNISVSGSANISGAGRKIQKYSLWYAPYDVTLNKWVDAPMDHTTLPAGWIGPIIPAIDYTPPQGHTWNCGIFSGSNIVSNGDLTKKWVKSTCPFGIPPEYWWLKLIRWDTSSLGSGRFTILLMVEDDLGGIYYDSQRVWIDNKKIVGYIKGIKGLKPCQDLKMSLGKVPILGEAYDPPIDDTITPIVHPNDNFKHYRLWFRKQGAGTYQNIPPGIINTPVGPGAGLLVEWDLEMLDAATNPAGLPKNQLLEAGEACPYTIALYVCDKTHVNDTATPHYLYDHWSVKIVNDIG